MLKIFQQIKVKTQQGLDKLLNRDEKFTENLLMFFMPQRVYALSEARNAKQDILIQKAENMKFSRFLGVLSFFIFTFLLVVSSNYAFADGDMDSATNALIKPFCYIIKLITGTVGKTIIVLILISLVIMLFLGKVSWGLALTFLFGVGLLFSSSTLVDMLGSTGAGGKSLDNVCQAAIG
jgi:type IV secretory pathway VirB2 component (pilin)